jgi:hypothetical protein
MSWSFPDFEPPLQIRTNAMSIQFRLNYRKSACGTRGELPHAGRAVQRDPFAARQDGSFACKADLLKDTATSRVRSD